MITVNFNKLKIRPGYRILDIGCGSGRHIGEAVRFKHTKVTGTDISYKDLRQAEKRLAFLEEIGEKQGSYSLAASNINHLPFKNNFFDLVICSEVLEHIPDHRKAASEIIRVLKPGKNLVVSVPRYMPEKICWLLSNEYHNNPGGHIRIYTTKELTVLLTQFGVRKWGFHWAHSLHTPYWCLKCLVGPEKKDSKLVNLYHQFLVWDMMKKPVITQFIEKLLNPVLGKSVVLYLTKNIW
ncbi:SAM-dependent methyltransferase [Desulfonema limicola]|uniref:SAM-dependent methyltransferase n=1 Tax=Desulfonema limicola TaxID=45656 RepID=A0A975B326_9BACT|nr:class I SAM-dependent methyltransferase [Desulfonema limicola]QTA77873.1 SAM-dependent methyltransferase [Desulfonema limicola]